ncbi:MAG: type 4a pilus biogenesis protein PilO [Nitrospirae bacterium]|nr:type 4a pilus biogenesis protein PilO [Nitrospirota bacterium]
MAAINLNLDKLHPGLKVLVAFIPALIIAIPFYLIIYSPKSDDIKKLVVDIKKLDGEIDDATKKAARIAGVKRRKERMEMVYSQIKKQLPEEGEISNLLKQVSDNAIASGLKITLWEPQARSNHPSNFLYVVPIRVEMRGSYHRLGDFLSRLTALDRIVSTSRIQLRTPALFKGEVNLSISLSASTFTAIQEKTPEKGNGK